MNANKKVRNHPGYKWVVVAACFLMIMVCLGFCSGTKSLYLTAITGAWGLDYSRFTVNDSIRYVATALVNLFFGSMVIRFGPRKLVAGGFVCLIISMALYSVARDYWLFYVAAAFLGIGQSWTSTSIVGYVVGRWCRESKGTIMGAVLAANGIGSAIAGWIITPLIKGSRLGYQNAYHVTVLVLVVAGIAVVLLLKDNPGKAVVAAPSEKKTKASGWYGLTLAQCLRHPYFYVMALYVFVMGLTIQSTSGIFVAHMEHVGLDEIYVNVVVFGIYSVGIAVTKFLTGLLYDRAGLRLTMLLSSSATAISVVLLSLLDERSQVLAIVFVIVYAIGVPLQTIGMPLITAEFFGHRDEARILGVLVSISTVGYAVGAPLVNLFYDLQKTYVTILLIMGGLMAVMTVASMLAMNAVNKRKKLCEEM